MTTGKPFFNKPFGAESCEKERAQVGSAYSEYYFRYTPFNDIAMNPDHYLFIGRRGAGKTSLAHYFTFQNSIRNAHCIDVDEPKIYADVLNRVSRLAGGTTIAANSRIVAIWEYVLWNLIIAEYGKHDESLKSASAIVGPSHGWCSLIKKLLLSLLNKYFDDSTGELSGHLEDLLLAPHFKDAQSKVLRLAATKPIIVAIDSLEKYAINDDPMMRSTAALIEATSNLHSAYVRYGIHVKVFVSAEIYPHIADSVISNYSKYIQNPVHLHWRPKDLVRLVCWRLNEFFRLQEEHKSFYKPSINWESPRDVVTGVWNPLFGTHVVNGRGRSEPTIGYVLRHSQLRPRQLVLFCNLVADESPRFPIIDQSDLVRAIKRQERELATEVLNSYSEIYPNIARIVTALHTCPAKFPARALDKLAPTTASQWPAGDYSPFRFRELLAELGILGRIREVRNGRDGMAYVDADFEYAVQDRLSIADSDECVIHPMFFEKLRVDTHAKIIVYPFPEHPDFQDYDYGG